MNSLEQLQKEIDIPREASVPQPGKLDHSKEAVFLEPALLEKGLKEMAGWGTAARGGLCPAS
ncbi:MAG: hypothetical protein GTN65_10225 [Armatimonadetes bacterium]|nr:hypothetical protein [Armatimonadota bacterium]NIO97448.1 hypothetical protein [Armatimonadota bacterium]